MPSLTSLRNVPDRLERAVAARRIRRQVERVESMLSERGENAGPPVLFFNASTRIHTLSLNAAFSLLAAWAVQLAGAPVQYVVCQKGMQQCVLGFQQHDYERPPPCQACIRFSEHLFPDQKVLPLRLDDHAVSAADRELEGLDIRGMSAWKAMGLPIGELCLPGMRWMLRRHHLPNDDETRVVFRQVLRSATSLAARLDSIYQQASPRAVVLFNGLMYPEAVARALAKRHGIPVVTHEVGLRPGSAHFSHGHATFRKVELGQAEYLMPDQELQLDEYLEQRRTGRFTMAGVRFWPEIEPMPGWLERKIRDYGQLVTVFTNVVFDTSQAHAKVLFQDMFHWLDTLRPTMESTKNTLFVIRAHPDEDRPGKQSRESVADWFRESGLSEVQNVAFLSPSDYISSYDLIDHSKFVLVYSSSIGLEASIRGIPVLSAGRSRYVHVPAISHPDSREQYVSRFKSWILSPRHLLEQEQIRSARTFLFHELYSASLDFSPYLEPNARMPGMVSFADFGIEQLETDPQIAVLSGGILEGSDFWVQPTAYQPTEARHS